MPGRALLATLLLLVLLPTGAAAAAVVTVGVTKPLGTPTADAPLTTTATCADGAGGTPTYVVPAAPGPAPAKWVVTSFRVAVEQAAGTAQLKVFRGPMPISCTNPLDYTPTAVAQSAVESYAAAADPGLVVERTTSIPVAPGDNIGLTTTSLDSSGNPGGTSILKNGDVGLGEVFMATQVVSSVPNIAATLESDVDGDGVADSADNCVGAANPGHEDLDGDGQGDACDPDDDNDGAADTSDNCAVTANADQLDTDRDGQGDACDEDDDNDGLADAAEARAGTSRLDLDSDDDGLRDLEEVRMGLNPARADTDADLLPDGREVGVTRPVAPYPGTQVLATDTKRFAPDRSPSTGTNPLKRDSDGDRIRDGREDLNRNGRKEREESDPRKRDTDGDGLLDSREDKNLNGAREAGETNPTRRDSDRDGYSDRRDRRPLDRSRH